MSTIRPHKEEPVIYEPQPIDAAGVQLEMALAVIARLGGAGHEFLMIRNANYRGYFFPAARLRTDTTPVKAAVDAVREDTGLFGPIDITSDELVADRHFSWRFNQERQYLFHVCRALLPGLELTQPGNKLETALKRTGNLWRWVPRGKLADPEAHGLSPHCGRRARRRVEGDEVVRGNRRRR